MKWLKGIFNIVLLEFNGVKSKKKRSFENDTSVWFFFAIVIISCEKGEKINKSTIYSQSCCNLKSIVFWRILALLQKSNKKVKKCKSSQKKIASLYLIIRKTKNDKFWQVLTCRHQILDPLPLRPWRQLWTTPE